jgi:hypothetical protein
VNFKPIVFIIGKPKSGKSSLAKLIEEKYILIKIIIY